jgi:hypothetical protein
VPPDSTYTFNENRVTPTTTQTLTINTATDTPPGSYAITTTGTAGGYSLSTTIQLAVANIG